VQGAATLARSPLGFSLSPPFEPTLPQRGTTKEERKMAKTITPDEVIRAARDLDQSEFTRDDLAGKLGVGKPKFKQAFKTARQSGQLEKVRDDADRKGRFRVT
jgi:predicted DNA-binding protein (UPF0251 family)